MKFSCTIYIVASCKTLWSGMAILSVTLEDRVMFLVTAALSVLRLLLGIRIRTQKPRPRIRVKTRGLGLVEHLDSLY